jgi:hypothetical protein
MKLSSSARELAVNRPSSGRLARWKYADVVIGAIMLTNSVEPGLG